MYYYRGKIPSEEILSELWENINIEAETNRIDLGILLLPELQKRASNSVYLVWIRDVSAHVNIPILIVNGDIVRDR